VQDIEAKLRSGKTKAMAVTIGRSVVWQQEIVQDMSMLISWPQFISWAGSAGAFW
jgi:hypothetical protein